MVHVTYIEPNELNKIEPLLQIHKTFTPPPSIIILLLHQKF